VTLDGRVKPGHGAYEGLRNQFTNVIPAKAGIQASFSKPDFAIFRDHGAPR